tara:strand:+ start:11451 stop:11600 length:150 start_codon:yes stop_codon:yes gene_type:complete
MVGLSRMGASPFGHRQVLKKATFIKKPVVKSPDRSLKALYHPVILGEIH